MNKKTFRQSVRVLNELEYLLSSLNVEEPMNYFKIFTGIEGLCSNLDYFDKLYMQNVMMLDKNLHFKAFPVIRIG